MSDSLRQSPLHERHVSLGAKFAGFGGWEMPIDYPTGVVAEHTAVRERVGLFDVSHLGKIVVRGARAADFINRTLSNDLDNIGPGQAQYTLCLNDQTGGIVDDLIVYRHSDERLLLMPNAANSGAVTALLRAAAPAEITINDLHDEYAVLAVQGPSSDEVLDALGLPTGHGYMSFVEAPWADGDVVVGRTGYTGERGYEIIVHRDGAVSLWDALMKAGVSWGLVPAGLGARDTLRTEMGYPLHGHDITLKVTPNQARLGWAVGWSKPEFWGRQAVIDEREAGPRLILRGLIALGRGIPRPGQQVLVTQHVPVGEITSGTFSPTLRKGIGLALVSAVVNAEAQVVVDIRGRREIFQITPPPFVASAVREE